MTMTHDIIFLKFSIFLFFLFADINCQRESPLFNYVNCKCNAFLFKSYFFTLFLVKV